MVVPPLAGLDFGTVGVRILAGAGDPNVASTDDKNGSIQSAGIGSLFLRSDAPDSTHALFTKTSLPNTWTNK